MPDVDRARLAVHRHVDRPADLDRDAEVVRQQVAGAGGQDADRGIEVIVDQGLDATANGAVAAPDEHAIDPVVADEFADLLRGFLALGHLVPSRVGVADVGERRPQLLEPAAEHLVLVDDDADVAHARCLVSCLRSLLAGLLLSGLRVRPSHVRPWVAPFPAWRPARPVGRVPGFGHRRRWRRS